MSFTDLHPINAAGLVLNGTMLLTLVICITLGRRHMRRSRARKGVVMLLTTPRQCLLGLRRIASSPHGYHLPPLTKEDRL